MTNNGNAYHRDSTLTGGDGKVEVACLSGLGKPHTFKSPSKFHRICPKCQPRFYEQLQQISPSCLEPHATPNGDHP